MYVGALTLDVLFGDVRSLKQKRSEVRPLIAEVHRKFPGLAVAETGHLDLHRRTEIGVAVVTSTASHAVEMLEACERFVAARPGLSCCPRASGCSTTKESEQVWTRRGPGGSQSG